MADQPDPLATVRAALDLAAKATPGPWTAELDIFDSDEGIVATVANKAGTPGDAWIPAQLLAVIATDLATTHDEYREDPAAARAKMEAQWRQARDGQELRDAAAIVALRNAAPAIADLCREVEAGRSRIATAESRIASIGAEIDRTLGEHAGGRISALEAARDRIATLEAELAQVRSKLKEAADLFIAIQATDGEEEHRAICDGAALAAKIDAATGAKE